METANITIPLLSERNVRAMVTHLYKEYKRSHDKVVSDLHSYLYRKYGRDIDEKYYRYKPEKVIEYNQVKIL